jgi:hypothetical protein
MNIRVNSPAAWRGRLVKVASINGSEAEVVWIGRDGDIQLRNVDTDELVSFQDAMRPQSSWTASAEQKSIRSWRAE